MKMIRTAGVALLFVTGFAHAEDIAWVGTISLDGRTTVGIVDTTEAGCNARIAELDQVAIIEACHPVEASRIQDNGDGSRRNGSRSVTGPVGSSGGTAAGGGRAVGGAGNMGGGH